MPAAQLMMISLASLVHHLHKHLAQLRIILSRLRQLRRYLLQIQRNAHIAGLGIHSKRLKLHHQPRRMLGNGLLQIDLPGRKLGFE